MERPLNALALLVLSLSALTFAVGAKLREAAPLEAAGRYALARDALSVLVEEIDRDECIAFLVTQRSGRRLDTYTIGELDEVWCSGTPVSDVRMEGGERNGTVLSTEGKPASAPMRQVPRVPQSGVPARPAPPGSLTIWSTPEALLYVEPASRTIFDARDLELARRYSAVTDVEIYNWQRMRDRAAAGTRSSGCDTRINPPSNEGSCLDWIPLAALRRLASIPHFGVSSLESDIQERFRATLPNIEMKVGPATLAVILAWATALLFGVFVAAVHAVGSRDDASRIWILKSLHGSLMFELVGIGLALVPAIALAHLTVASVPVNAAPFLLGLAWIVTLVLTGKFIAAVWADGALVGTVRRTARRFK